MAEKTEPISATVWDRRMISSIRRELEKGFAALTSAYDRAQQEQTEDAQDEVTKLARRKDAEMRGAAPQLTPAKIVLNPSLMTFCPEFPFVFCRDKVHRDTYLN